MSRLGEGEMERIGEGEDSVSINTHGLCTSVSNV